MTWQEIPTQELRCDVLVVGGGLAGLMAALAATRLGVRVFVACKGFAGADGVSPFAGGVTAYLLPGDDMEAFMDDHLRWAEGLVCPQAVQETVTKSADLWTELGRLGAPLERTADGQLNRRWLNVGSRTHIPRLCLNSVELMKFLRRQARRSCVRILDQLVITKLLRSPDGRFCGAVGFRRQQGSLVVLSAKAIVLAAGGCAWRGAHMGVHSAMGEGYELAAEAGAPLGCIEYATSYIATCRLFDTHGQCVLAALGGKFYNRLGENILERHREPDPAPTHRLALAMLTELREGRGPIYFDLRRISQQARHRWRTDFHLVAKGLSRTGVDIFEEPTEWFPGFTGSIAAGGGVFIRSLAGDTDVAGLYVAGDTACRASVVGAASGITYMNLAWAISSGYWAGRAAANYALEADDHVRPERNQVREALEATVAPLFRSKGQSPIELLCQLQRWVVDPEINFFRTEGKLVEAEKEARRIWHEANEAKATDWHELANCYAVRSAALTAVAMFAAAQQRRETRGWHRRLDFPQRDDVRWDCWTLTWVDTVNGDLRLRIGTANYRDKRVFQPNPSGGSDR